MPANKKSHVQPCLYEAYELGIHLTAHMQPETHPLKNLPLAICSTSNICQAAATYAFPSVASGRWVLFQKSTEASMFLSHWVIKHHKELLTESQQHLLSTSMQFAQTVLRCIKPFLPDQQALQEAHAKVCQARLAFRDGWLDTATLQFHALPYMHEHMVFHSTLPYTYQKLMQIKAETLQQASSLLTNYLPVEEERTWLIRYLARCLAPSDGHKVLLCLTDSLGDTPPGNSAKSTLLSWLQSATGNESCSIQSGQALTIAHSIGHAASNHSFNAYAPLIQCYDEISRSTKVAAQQMNYSRLKYLTSGRKNQPAVIIAANVGDWPNLEELQQVDPSFLGRLVMVPARGRFTADTEAGMQADAVDMNIHAKLDRLAPAFARILLDAFKSYKRDKNQLLPLPPSMHTFKELVVRSSVLAKHVPCHALFARQWVACHVCHNGNHSLPAETLLQLFRIHWSDNQHNNRNTATLLLQELLDAALATCGVSVSGDRQQYLGIWLRGLQNT